MQRLSKIIPRKCICIEVDSEMDLNFKKEVIESRIESTRSAMIRDEWCESSNFIRNGLHSDVEMIDFSYYHHIKDSGLILSIIERTFGVCVRVKMEHDEDYLIRIRKIPNVGCKI